MHSLFLHTDAREPRPLRLYESLRERIVEGELKPGERLPPTRAVARDLAMPRSVVVAAYRQLLSEGYVQARVGSGTWVSPVVPDALLTAPPAHRPRRNGSRAEPRLSELARHAVAANPARLERRLARAERECISFSLESALADGISTEIWTRLVRGHLEHPPPGYGPPEGCLELRRALAEYLRQSRGIAADPEQIVTVAGAQQGIDLLARALLQPGDGVVIEDPGFRGARLAFETLGARIVACPVDRSGIDIRRAAERPAETPAAEAAGLRAGRQGRRPLQPQASGSPVEREGAIRLAFVTPSHQFPTGEVMSLARRRELLDWAHAANAIVVEDDYEGEFRFAGRPLPAIHALDGEARVVYLGTFSRILYPDLRLGYMVLPRSLVEPIAALKRLSDGFTPVTPQAALADFIGGGHYQRHLRRLQRQMRDRRHALLASLEAELGDAVEVTGAASGLHVAVWFHEPGPQAEGALVANARDLRVSVHPLSPFCITAPSRLGVLLGYSRLRDAEIREGVRRLAMAWRATRRALVAPAASGLAVARG
ncbi:MAG: PLP-dependent aminotransferase family protein [Thermoanaerobaculia bacterium]